LGDLCGYSPKRAIGSKSMRRLISDIREHGLLGVRFAVNVFIATTALWILLRYLADTNPIWAIASMVATSEPVVKNALRMFRARSINVLVGCAIGLVVLEIGGTSPWKLPIAMSIAVLVSSYVVRIQTMWRQAPITAAIVIASGVTEQSKTSGMEHGLHKVAEVILGCLMGLLVTWLISRVWPMREAQGKPEAQPVKA
jgi:uncharacterized membrane protein YccC